MPMHMHGTTKSPCFPPGYQMLCSFHAITSRLVAVGCDNVGALHQAQQNQDLTPCSTAPADLERAIHWVHWSITGVTIHFKHVMGHQDDLLSVSSLHHLAQLNILADQLAKHSLLHLLQHHQCQMGLLMGDTWSLQIDK